MKDFYLYIKVYKILNILKYKVLWHDAYIIHHIQLLQWVYLKKLEKIYWKHFEKFIKDFIN